LHGLNIPNDVSHLMDLKKTRLITQQTYVIQQQTLGATS